MVWNTTLLSGKKKTMSVSLSPPPKRFIILMLLFVWLSPLLSILTLSHMSSFCHTSLSLNLVKSLPPTILSLSLLSSPPWYPFMLLTHLLHVYLLLNQMSCSSPLLSPSFHLSFRTVVKWTDVSAGLIIPPAAVCQLQLYFPHVSLSPPTPTHTHLCLSLSPPLYSLPSFTLSCLVFSVSLSLHPSHVGSHRLFYFPLRLACQEDSTPCPAVWCCSVGVCLCVCTFCTLLWVSICTCVFRSGEESERERLCPSQLHLVWLWLFLFVLEAVRYVYSYEK